VVNQILSGQNELITGTLRDAQQIHSLR
jgi:hypothetical protein